MQGPHAATPRPQPRRRRWEMLGNEPNQGRVISRNHSMKSKLGTVRVWTRAVEGLVELRTQDLRGTSGYVCPCACVFWNRGCLGVLVLVLWPWLLWPWRSGPGALALVLSVSGCLAAHIPSPPPVTCRHDGAQFLVCGATLGRLCSRWCSESERQPPPPPQAPHTT